MLLLAVLCVVVIAGGVQGGRSESNYTVTEEVWFDFEIKDYDGPGEDYRGHVIIAMFGETTPMTCMNFQTLAKGFKRGHQKLQYKNSVVHRVVPDFVLQMGDIISGDGSGSVSIYGDKFVDENFSLSHRAMGYVSMANTGKDSNGSQFFIMLGRARWLDGMHVVFGKVVEGIETIRTIGDLNYNKQTGEPKKRVKVVGCGVKGLKHKYTLTEEQAKSEEDIEDEREYE